MASFFVKKLKLEIGGMRCWDTCTEALQMKYLMDGFATTPDWMATFPVSGIDALRTSKESIFDYTDEERTIQSQIPHVCFFEPFNLKDLAPNQKYPLPIIAMRMHEIKFLLETNSLENCLEPIVEGTPLPPDFNRQALLKACSFENDMLLLDVDERRRLAANIGGLEYQTKHFEYCSNVFEAPQAANELTTYISGDLLCTSAYIWITDENDKELPYSVVESLATVLHHDEHHRMTGQMSRFGIQEKLPHPTITNNISKNLYYISYYPGRQEQGVEQGLNLSRIDMYFFKFRLNRFSPPRIKIHTLHRVQNKLRIMDGMCGMNYMNNRLFQISTNPFVYYGVPHYATVPAEQFENIDQQIPIPVDEPQCIITWVNHAEGDAVQQCLQCKKVMNSEALDKWFEQHQFDRKCVHCRYQYSATTFRKGKAHLLVQ